MSTTFPTTKQSIPNPTSTDLLENADATLDHDYQHSTINDTIEALQDKVGIDGSATTTTHDYKLSAVTGSAKALTSGTSTQSVTGLTLVTPTLTLGSDATGDMYYRNGSGVLTRLPAGTDGQIIAYSSGLPTAIANPSASAASQTAAGVIEIATTAEQTTGTDDTRASTPKSVHDMTSLAGAAWFLDEDTMSSDSATKTASQQSIKAYVDTTTSNLLSSSPNTSPTINSFYTYEVPYVYSLQSGPTESLDGWNTNGLVTSITDDERGGAGLSSIGGSGDWYIQAGIPGNGSNETYSIADSKDLLMKFRIKAISSTPQTGERLGFGIVDTTGDQRLDYNTINKNIRFVWTASGTLYACNANGTTATTTDISSGITMTDWNVFEIVLNPGTDIKFYVNGTLKATHTTNMPTGSMRYMAIGYEFNGGSAGEISVLPSIISLQM